ncbi:hypothetical protein HA145_00245 [Prochlorococcus marinus XMU1411]|nr:hypothetical protein [Prochlorococcus marinus]MBO8242910.1 hypothetical protein [Prochlorococcus marinus XMU1411]MCR8537599.1 hypothetical protein [Prochlorococcus marinus CUG1430]
MSQNFSSNNNENNDSSHQESDYENLIKRLKEISTNISLLEKKILR